MRTGRTAVALAVTAAVVLAASIAGSPAASPEPFALPASVAGYRLLADDPELGAHRDRIIAASPAMAGAESGAYERDGHVLYLVARADAPKDDETGRALTALQVTDVIQPSTGTADVLRCGQTATGLPVSACAWSGPSGTGYLVDPAGTAPDALADLALAFHQALRRG